MERSIKQRNSLGGISQASRDVLAMFLGNVEWSQERWDRFQYETGYPNGIIPTTEQLIAWIVSNG